MIASSKKKKKNNKGENSLDTLSRTFLSSLIIILIFFITPIAIDLTKKNNLFSKDFENNSKNNLKKLLKKKNRKSPDKAYYQMRIFLQISNLQKGFINMY